MKNKELIKLLLQFPEEAEVTTSDKKGTFMSVDGVEMQSWQVNDKKHSSVTLVLGKYDEENTEDEKFIDSVNNELKGGLKIDKKEAIEAKKSFEEQLAEKRKKLDEEWKKKYDKMAATVKKELFEDEKPLSEKTIGDLKYYVYRNGWQDEVNSETLNNREYLIKFLDKKLDKIVRRRISGNGLNKFLKSSIEIPGDDFNFEIELPVICDKRFRKFFDELFL